MSYEEVLVLDTLEIEGGVSPYGYVTLDAYNVTEGAVHVGVADLDKALSFFSNLREALVRQETT